jgi:hypothetical protein
MAATAAASSRIEITISAFLAKLDAAPAFLETGAAAGGTRPALRAPLAPGALHVAGRGRRRVVAEDPRGGGARRRLAGQATAQRVGELAGAGEAARRVRLECDQHRVANCLWHGVVVGARGQGLLGLLPDRELRK